MTHAELQAQLAAHFDGSAPARMRFSVVLAKDIAENPDGTVVVEVVGVDPDPQEPSVLILTVQAQPPT